jgi:hypothetical protein
MNYSKDMIIEIDKDWITDFTFDFSKEFAAIDSFSIDVATGFTAQSSMIIDSNKIMVRLSGGVVDASYPVTVSAMSPNGEKRDMTVIFLAQ